MKTDEDQVGGVLPALHNISAQRHCSQYPSCLTANPRVCLERNRRLRVCMRRPCIWGVGRVQFITNFQFFLCATPAMLAVLPSTRREQSSPSKPKPCVCVCVCVCVGRPIRPPSHAGTMRKPSLQCRWIYTSRFTQVSLPQQPSLQSKFTMLPPVQILISTMHYLATLNRCICASVAEFFAASLHSP